MKQAVKATILTTPEKLVDLKNEVKVISQKEAIQLNLSYPEIKDKIREAGKRKSWDPVFYVRTDTSEIIEGRDSNLTKTTELIPIPSYLCEYYGWSQGIEYYYLGQDCHFDLFTRDLLDYQHKLLYGGAEDCIPLPYNKSKYKTIPEYIKYAADNGYPTIEDDWCNDIDCRLEFNINLWIEAIERGQDLKNKYIVNWIE